MPGMLVLGWVRHVNNFDMDVSLPNGLTGTVAITDFSDAYTSLLQALADGTESDLAEDKVCHLMRGFIFCRHFTKHATYGHRWLPIFKY